MVMIESSKFTMKSLSFALSLSLGFALGCATAAPDPLTWQSYESVKSHVAPKKKDFAFKNVDWHMNLPDAISQATEADKPLLLWLYFGNPQGNC